MVFLYRVVGLTKNKEPWEGQLSGLGPVSAWNRTREEQFVAELVILIT